ncbi:type II toxin-antitoxin system RelE/ParE family toxin [Pseudorhodoferax sp. Leaf267]|uniref:type II toxin-antitoxin system RelE/ParE family toxin n=1 Tax=Pseudorhodoferax sp. Leaf267 TaxID=1736316 RepID=UPI0006F3EF86|nr:type II toxin-antitoxin system RelE/ParE family toxin [Pseudorhodoferax sp. Leaf267]KQP22534.1 addiction module toxin RelE [Pseudorhodoferax sp. Leaf267]
MIAPAVRTFKTAWFDKAARKARITDAELCRAIYEVMQGQADDLGGGVFKKRLHHNQYRTIILAKGQRFWVYAYLFAKSDRANIDEAELRAFRELADLYAHKTDKQVDKELATHALLEICHEHQTQVQERRL